jgi:hypothetical protein
MARGLTVATLRDGREHSAKLGTFILGIQVRADASTPRRARPMISCRLSPACHGS